MNHFSRQTIAFTAGGIAALGLAVGGVALANGADDAPAEQPSSQAEHSLAAVTHLVECVDDNLVQEPDSFTVTCADGNAYLSDLQWQDWGADEASASGDLVVNTCDPTCVDGTMETFGVEVTAGGLVHGEASQSYGTLTLHFTDEVPEGFDQDEVLPQLGLEPVPADLDQ